MNNDVEHFFFHVAIYYLYDFFGEVYLNLLPNFNWFIVLIIAFGKIFRYLDKIPLLDIQLLEGGGGTSKYSPNQEGTLRLKNEAGQSIQF